MEGTPGPFAATAALYIKDVQKDYAGQLVPLKLTFNPTQYGAGTLIGPTDQIGPVPSDASGLAYWLYSVRVNVCETGTSKAFLQVFETKKVETWTPATNAWANVPQLSEARHPVFQGEPPLYPVPSGGTMSDFVLAKRKTPDGIYTDTIVDTDIANIASRLKPVPDAWATTEFDRETITQDIIIRDSSQSGPIVAEWLNSSFMLGIDQNGKLIAKDLDTNKSYPT
jgi:hypothetical protein